MSAAVQQYADNVRGIRLDVAAVEELAAWAPEGTVHFDHAVPRDAFPEAVRVLRRAGFRIRAVAVEKWRCDVGVGFSAFRHVGVKGPSGEQQIETRERLLAAAEDVPAELDRLVALLGASVPRDGLDVIRPDAWPTRPMFPRW